MKTIDRCLTVRNDDPLTWDMQRKKTVKETRQRVKGIAGKIFDYLKLLFSHYRDGTLPDDLELSI